MLLMRPSISSRMLQLPRPSTWIFNLGVVQTGHTSHSKHTNMIGFRFPHNDGDKFSNRVRCFKIKRFKRWQSLYTIKIFSRSNDAKAGSLSAQFSQQQIFFFSRGSRWPLLKSKCWYFKPLAPLPLQHLLHTKAFKLPSGQLARTLPSTMEDPAFELTYLWYHCQPRTSKNMNHWCIIQ